MATYLSPGVYVKEIDSGPKPIAGVPTSVGALIGMTEKGPVQEPTRLTSWNDYLATFGGSIAGSYTAEAAFGFFQNGGTALWVTRADTATLSTWQVRDGAGAASFVIEADSPGNWSSGIELGVSRASGGGQGLPYASRITGPGASAALTANATVTVNVDNTTGAALGMPVVVNDVTGGAAIEATITGLGTGQLTLTTGAAGRTVQIADEPWVAARLVQNAATLDLATGSGFQAGDVIVAVAPDGSSQGAAVKSVAAVGVGVRLALQPGLGGNLPGADFKQRTVSLPATIGPPAGGGSPESVPLGRISGVAGLTGPDMVRLILGSGLSATWSSNRFAFPTGTVPDGPAQLVARLSAVAYEEAITLTIEAGADASRINTLLGRFNFVPVGAKLTLTRTTPAADLDFTRTATGWTAPASSDGDYTRAKVTPSTAQGLDATKGVVVTAAVAPEVGNYVDFGAGVGLRPIAAVDHPEGTPPNVHVLRFGATFGGNPTGTRWPVMAWQTTRVQTLRFNVTASLDAPGTAPITEAYSNLSLNPGHPRYYLADGVINGVSRLIRAKARTATTSLESEDSLPVAVVQAQTGGLGVFTVEGIRAALEQLERASEPALLAAPDVLQLGDDLQMSAAYGELIVHAEAFRRFALVDLPAIASDTKLLEWRLLHLDSTHAAAYAPFVRILNPRPGAGPQAVDVPPSGFVMGVYARTDNDRGVWKAPANERVDGVVGLQREYTQRRQDLLNPRGVNLLRPFSGRGTRVWGARNLTDDTTWRYVNVRRLFLFLENSIDGGTQWVVFEPNTATTWLRVRVSVEDFLNQVWRAGGLAGATPEQAYRVRCGLGTTMTETDIELGLLIIEVAVAPVYPAEFVVFRISHKRLAE